jgi:hypothetical protein
MLLGIANEREREYVRKSVLQSRELPEVGIPGQTATAMALGPGDH